jgi:flavin-dependent dehydrogenase
MEPAATQESSYDVVMIGGALAGAASAILLLREQPRLRVLIIEKSSRFGRRVGEATIEVSAYFLTRTLGLTQHLNESHIAKQGFRFWFANARTQQLDQCSEIGGKYLARVAAFQVDRAVLDEEVLQKARSLGAAVWRPATVQRVELVSGGQQTLQVQHGDRTETVRARWLIDASGVAAFLARQNGWWRPNLAHPTTAVWSRWKGVKDLDGWEVAEKFPKWAMACYGIRGAATNHLMGDGWWAWMIPLKGGDVSVGVVFDQRLVQWPEKGLLGQRLKEFLCQHPFGRELLEGAKWQEGDVHWRKNLPYFSTTFAGDGFFLVGDAAAFLDPLYSPGMDWVAFTVTAATRLILAERGGESVLARVEKHNRDFSQSYERWFDAVYRNKYDYLGDYELMRLAFMMDLGCYYLGVASQPYRRGLQALTVPLYSDAPSAPVYQVMRIYNRRFAQIARARRARNALGRRNDRRRFLIPGFTFAPTSGIPIVRALFGWFALELKEGWRTWFAKPREIEPALKSMPGAPPVQRNGTCVTAAQHTGAGVYQS